MSDEIRYQTGFGNEFATEAVSGGLPQGQNAPQKHSLGLYTEQFSGTPFTTPRATNRRTWTYRIRPSVTHRPYEEIPMGLIRSGHPSMQTGIAIHMFAANTSMRDRFFANADGELLIVPQLGEFSLHTELG